MRGRHLKTLNAASYGIALLVLFLVGLVPLSAQNLPSAAGFVNDFAGVLSEDDARKLSALATAVREKTGAEIAVAAVDSFAPYATIDEFAFELASAWGIGRKGKDDGVLLVLAMKERKVKIEVGYGLEGAIPDSAAGRILDEAVLPAFRAGDFSAGMVKGAEAIAVLIAKEHGIDPSVFDLPESIQGARETPEGTGFGIGPLILLLFFVLIAGRRIFWPLLFMGSMGRFGSRRGGFGSGSFGGGGFGGGSFGGGGASRGF